MTCLTTFRNCFYFQRSAYAKSALQHSKKHTYTLPSLSSDSSRLKMLRLLVSGTPKFPLYLRASCPSFSTTTKCRLREEKREYPNAEFIEKNFTDDGTVLLVPPDDTTTPDLFPSDLFTRTVMLNFGPCHPGAHGLIRLILTMKEATRADVIERADPHIGFMHRGTEKLMETKTYMQGLPYMDRLDYLSAMCNEQCFSLAVERLLRVHVPKRAQCIRGTSY